MLWKLVEPTNQRTEFVLEEIKTDNFGELCREYGFTSKTRHRWRVRFWEHGLSGLSELSRRPKSSPNSLDQCVVRDCQAQAEVSLLGTPQDPQSEERTLRFQRAQPRAGRRQRERMRRFGNWIHLLGLKRMKRQQCHGVKALPISSPSRGNAEGRMERGE